MILQYPAFAPHPSRRDHVIIAVSAKAVHGRCLLIGAYNSLRLGVLLDVLSVALYSSLSARFAKCLGVFIQCDNEDKRCCAS